MADEEDDLDLGGDDDAPASDRTVKKADNRKSRTEKALEDDDPVQGDQLKSIVERIERLEEEKKTIADDIKEVYAEAKGSGYDVKVLRKAVAIRKRDADERAEEEAILQLYLDTLGVP